MTYPQSSPSPSPPPYPATRVGKRIFCNGPIGIQLKGAYPIDGWGHESIEGLQDIEIFEKIEAPEFPLDLLFTTEEVTMVGSNLAWAELPQFSPGDGTSPESIFMNDGKRWDDNVGQYPQHTTATSNEGFLEFLADLAERQRILAKGLFLLKHTGTDFVGRAGEM